MPTSVPMFPDAHALEGSDFFYLLQGMNLDRDKKVTLERLREFASLRGADVRVENAPASGDWEIDVTNSRSLFVYVQGPGAGRVTLTGSVPPGHSVFLQNMTTPASVEMEATDGNCFPAIGTVDRLGSFTLNRVGVADWACVHTMDRNDLNSYFSSLGQAIGNVASSLGTAIGNEQTRAENAEAALAVDVAAATADLREVDLSTESSVDISGDSDQLIRLLNGSGASYAIVGALPVGKRATIYNDSDYSVTLTAALTSSEVRLAIGESLEVLVVALLNLSNPTEMIMDFSVTRPGPVTERATASVALNSSGYAAAAQVAKKPGTYLVSGWVEVDVTTAAGSITAAVCELRDQGLTGQRRTFSLPAVWKTPAGKSARLFLSIPSVIWKTTATSGDYCELDVTLTGGGVADTVKCELVAQRISAVGPFA